MTSSSTVNLRAMKLLRIFRGDTPGKVIKEYSNGQVVMDDDDDKTGETNGKTLHTRRESRVHCEE